MARFLFTLKKELVEKQGWRVIHTSDEPIEDFTYVSNFDDEDDNMQAERIDHMLRFTYEKSSEEIKAKAQEKIKALRAKIEEREGRVAKTRKEYGVTAEVWSRILELMRDKANANVTSYSVSNNLKSPGNTGKANEETVVPAGVVNNILTENDYISAETSQVTKLELVVRNLKDLKDDGEVRGHRLNEQELTYLGF